MNAHRFGRKVVGLILTVLILVVGGIGATSAAAKAAIPGDALYSLKTGVEQARLSLASDAGDRAELKIRFADRRLEEIAALIREGRHAEVSQSVLAFELDLNSAILELGSLSKEDPARAGRIASEITASLTRYATILSGLAASAPESVRPDVLRALDTTRIVGGLDLSSSGVSSLDDNSNSSVYDDNSNTSLDDNSNSSLEDNSNSSLDENGNTNDDSGSNSNTNDDSGSNSNTNDDHGSNSNTNDDSGGTNTNDGSGGSSNTNDDHGGGGGGGGGGSDDNTNGGSHD